MSLTWKLSGTQLPSFSSRIQKGQRLCKVVVPCAWHSPAAPAVDGCPGVRSSVRSARGPSSNWRSYAHANGASPSHGDTPQEAAPVATTSYYEEDVSPTKARLQQVPVIGVALGMAYDYVSRFRHLWGSFLPMVTLFFCLSFINTILDSLKDTLVITAVGGGAEVIPYLTVYAVLPSSVLFLMAYSLASQRMSRQAVFNTVVGVFMAFFLTFGTLVYPNIHYLHPHGLADSLQQVLPEGLTGLVGMVRNWTFTLFFCMSELWGDVCLGLLFWGLANDTTSLENAPLLYPLFGLGANVAQAIAGMVLKISSGTIGSNFTQQIQLSMGCVALMAVLVVLVHNHISSRTRPRGREYRLQQWMEQQKRRKRAAKRGMTALKSAKVPTAHAAQTVSSQNGNVVNGKDAHHINDGNKRSNKDNLGLKEVWNILLNSMEIRCLAIMSIAQGLCTSLMEFAWKCHIRILFPSPADFTAFLGDVATWTGVVTAGLMVLSPILFQKLRWNGVAQATPQILLYGGCAFFGACIAWQHVFGQVAASAMSGSTLQALVMLGALLYIFSKGAKFSLFKPAEEMVYITMDEVGRTRGKAAIDVVGAQTGKSVGSILQQVLLIMSSGAIHGIMPVLFVVFFAMVQGWLGAVRELSKTRKIGDPEVVTDSEEEGGQAAGMNVSTRTTRSSGPHGHNGGGPGVLYPVPVAA